MRITVYKKQIIVFLSVCSVVSLVFFPRLVFAVCTPAGTECCKNNIELQACTSIDFSGRGKCRLCERIETSKSINISSQKDKVLNLSTDVLGVKEVGLGKDGLDLSQEIFRRLFRILFALAGTLTVLLFAIHGTQMIYAQMTGNMATLYNAKSKLKDIIIGIVILLLSWIILNFVSPNLLKPVIFEHRTTPAVIIPE